MNPEQAFRTLMRGWERSDAGAVAALFAEDGSYEDPLLDATPVGPAAIGEAIMPAVRAIEGCKIEITNIISSGFTGFCEGIFTSHLAGESTRFDFPFAAVVEMRDEKISRLTEYFDTRPLPS